jgi:hypothetical protein
MIGFLAFPRSGDATIIFRDSPKIGTRIGTAVGLGFLNWVCKLGKGTWFRVPDRAALMGLE